MPAIKHGAARFHKVADLSFLSNRIGVCASSLLGRYDSPLRAYEGQLRADLDARCHRIWNNSWAISSKGSCTLPRGHAPCTNIEGARLPISMRRFNVGEAGLGWMVDSSLSTRASNFPAPRRSFPISGLGRERLPELPQAIPSGRAGLVCEIRSPATRRHDQLVKKPFRRAHRRAASVDRRSRRAHAHDLPPSRRSWSRWSSLESERDTHPRRSIRRS